MKLKKFIYIHTHPLFRLYWQVLKPKTSGVKALVLHEKNILLVKNIQKLYWSLPGGGIGKEESPTQCLKRELSEELNLNTISITKKLGEYYAEKEGKKDKVHVFVVNTPSLDFTKSWELDDARWFSLRDLPKEISRATSCRIKEFYQGKVNIVSDW